MVQQHQALGVQKALSPLATKLPPQASLCQDYKAVSPSHQELHVQWGDASLGYTYSSSLCMHWFPGDTGSAQLRPARPQMGARCHVYGEQP